MEGVTQNQACESSPHNPLDDDDFESASQVLKLALSLNIYLSLSKLILVALCAFSGDWATKTCVGCTWYRSRIWCFTSKWQTSIRDQNWIFHSKVSLEESGMWADYQPVCSFMLVGVFLLCPDFYASGLFTIWGPELHRTRLLILRLFFWRKESGEESGEKSKTKSPAPSQKSPNPRPRTAPPNSSGSQGWIYLNAIFQYLCNY